MVSILAYCQPNPTNISGSRTHKGTITITGTAFGIKPTAAPRLMDWCDASGTSDLDTYYDRDDDCTSDFYRGAPVGGGSIPNPGDTDCEIAYKTLPWKNHTSPDGRITKVIGTGHTTSNGSWIGSTNADMMFTIPEWNADTLLLMYWYRADSNYSDEDSPSGENWKELTPNGSESGHSGCYLDGADGVTWGPCGNGCPNETYPGDVFYMGGSIPSCATGERVYTHNPMVAWTFFEHLWTPSGHYFYSTVGSGTVKGGWANVSIQGANPGNRPYSITMGGYNRFPRTGAVDNYRMWAGIYADDTFARVMLGNASTWSNCTIRVPQIPSAWSTSIITATVNLGSLDTENPIYLYVFDEDNISNSTGLLFIESTGNANKIIPGKAKVIPGNAKVY
jgi:hypothetical protein